MREENTVKVLHTVEKQVIKLEAPEEFNSINTGEYVFAEFTKYKDCKFDCNIESEIIFYFDECIFENCTFLGRENNKSEIHIIGSKIKNTEFNGNYININIKTSIVSAVRFTQCNIKALVLAGNDIVKKVGGYDSNIDWVNLLNNLNYSQNNFANNYLDTLRFVDKQPLSTYIQTKDIAIRNNINIVERLNKEAITDGEEED